MTEEEAVDFTKQVLGTFQLNAVQEVVFRQTWGGKSYIQIANAYDYDYGYIKDIGSQLWQLLSQVLGEKVKKQNLKAVLSQCAQLRQPAQLKTSPATDWEEAIDISAFYGRQLELDTLSQWVIQERCRLVAILGMGGIGKTSLATKFAQQHQGSFGSFLWRSLLNAPLATDLLADLIQNLSPQLIVSNSSDLSGQIAELLSLLKQQRCLIVLDNLESILRPGTTVGTYLPGYEDYQVLLKKLAEVQHHSCILFTSREKPQQVAVNEASLSAVRSLSVPGLSLPAGQAIFIDRGFQEADCSDLDTILEHYGGNPLALKIVAASIQELLNGDVASLLPYLQTGQLKFTDINDILQQQLARISSAEQIVMGWLMVNRIPVSLEMLATDINPGQDHQLPQLLLTMQALKRRSLVEQSNAGWYLQPVVMEFITTHFIEQIADEIITSQPQYLCQLALVKSHSHNYIRQTQGRLLLQPILVRLHHYFGPHPDLWSQAIRSLLQQLQQPTQLFSAYAPGNLLNLLTAQQSDLNYLDCSQLPIWQADLVGSNLQNTNFSQATFHHTLFTQPFSAVLNAEFSPDGQLLAASNANGQIQLWRLQDSQCHLTLSGHQNWVRRVTFSPNGQLLASTSDDLTVRIWDTQTGTSQRTIQRHSFTLDAKFCPTGQRLVTALADGHLKIWDTHTWQMCQEFPAHQGWACRASFSPDGQQIVSGGADNIVRLWDLEGNCDREMSGHQGWIFAVLFSPDGHQILSAALDRTLRLWDRQTGDCLQVFTGHTGWIWSAAFSPDGQQLASTGDDCTIRLWDTNSGLCQRVIQGHTDQVWSVAYHPQGDRLATGSDDQTIRLWDAHDGKCLQVIQGWLNWVLAIAYQPQGQYLVSGHNDRIVRIWNMTSHKCTQELTGHLQIIRTVAWHPSLPLVVSGSDDKTIKVWDLEHQPAVCRYTMSGHADSINALTFSPDGQLLASASSDATIRLWQPLQNECLACCTGHQDKVRDLEFSSCGRYLVSVSEDQTAKVWDVQTEQCVYTFTGHTDRLIALAFHPAGQQVATAGQDNRIKIWNIQTGEILLDINYPGGWVLALAYSACGQWLVNGGNDRQVCVWDASTGECLQSIPKHTNWVWDVAIDPRDGSMASASADETICLWEWSSWQALGSLQVDRPYENMNITAAEGLTAAQIENLKKLGAVEIPTFPDTSGSQSDRENNKLLPINFRKNQGKLAN